MESGRGFPTPSPAAEGGNSTPDSFERPAPRSRQFCRSPYRALPSADNCVSGPRFFNPLALTTVDEAVPRALEEASFSAQRQGKRREVVFTPSGGPRSLRRRPILTGNHRIQDTRRARRSWQERRIRESNALFWASWTKQEAVVNGSPRATAREETPCSPAPSASRMRFPLLCPPPNPCTVQTSRPCSDPSALIQGSGCSLAQDDSRHSVPAPGQHGTTWELRKPIPSSSTPALSVTVAVSKSANTSSDALDATLWRCESTD